MQHLRLDRQPRRDDRRQLLRARHQQGARLPHRVLRGYRRLHREGSARSEGCRRAAGTHDRGGEGDPSGIRDPAPVAGMTSAPNLNAELVEAIGGRYLSTEEISIADATQQFGPFDIIFEATGYSPIAFDSMLALAKNGVLVLSSVTGGDRKVEVPADRINLEFVLGNKVVVGTVNANREHFEIGVRDLSQAALEYPGWLNRLLTHPVQGLENYEQLFQHLTKGSGTIKVYCEIAA